MNYMCMGRSHLKARTRSINNAIMRLICLSMLTPVFGYVLTNDVLSGQAMMSFLSGVIVISLIARIRKEWQIIEGLI